MAHKHYSILWVDDNMEAAKATAKLIELKADTPDLSIKIEVKFPEDIEDLVAEISTKNINALITDLRLNEKTNQEGEKVEYRGNTLVEEIRQRVSEKNYGSNTYNIISDMPVILISSHLYVKKQISYSRNEFILFDDRFLREDVTADNKLDYFTSCLISYCEGYENINNRKNKDIALAKYFFNLKEAQENWLHPDVYTYLNNADNFPSYKIAQFILRELLERPSDLVDEKILAARLGVDLEESKQTGAWEQLLEALKTYAYTGIFSRSHKRWWFSGIQDFWDEEMEISLKGSTAEKRVDALKTKLGIENLVVAEAIDAKYFTSDTRFWTICQYYQKPLSLSDAFTIYEEHLPHHWQSKYYLSKAAAMKRVKLDGILLRDEDKEEIKNLENKYNFLNKGK